MEKNMGYIKPKVNKDGYEYFVAEKDGKKNTILIHNAVWETFRGRIPEGYKVSHIDGNKRNNRLDNLKLVLIN